MLVSADPSTADRRSGERVRRARLTAITGAAARGISTVTALFALHITLPYLGQERFGLWQTIVGVLGMLAFADLGIGNGLLTGTAQANGRNDPGESKRLISTAFFLLGAAALVMLLIFGAIYSVTPWGRIFNVTSEIAMREAGPAMGAVVVCLALTLPLGIVQKVQAGHQEGYQSNLWDCLASILRLATLVVAISFKASLPLLALIVMGATVLVSLLNSTAYFGFQRQWLRPAWSCVHRQNARSLLRSGAAFLAISVLMAVGISSDNVVVAQVFGASAVPQLSVPSSLASPLYFLPQIAFMPMWGAYGEALARGELDWVKLNVRRLLRATVLVTALGALGYILSGPWAIHLLVGHRVAPSRLLMLGLALWAVEVAAAGPAFMVLNAAGRLREQVWMYSAFTLVSISLKIAFARAYGVVAIPWATAVSYFVLILVPLTISLPRVFADLQGRRGSRLPLLSPREQIG